MEQWLRTVALEEPLVTMSALEEPSASIYPWLTMAALEELLTSGEPLL